ncbi:TIGR04066 family peptide maturation system protein [Clostridium sp. YIM B02555]|uniref:TIGR04066 family peptide maturation system protein n=1 Tax=Clostridium sp. YIM B02555 TaxID=2911968 RepID=UPI001EEE9EB7|nr:TIGR04066 family peptide maturation system protein [Clostridium sp. YIM B02555]
MKKLMIYPFDKEVTDIARYRENLKNYQLINVISPKGWGLNGKDSNKLDGGKETGMIISEEFEDALKKCDAVFFSDTKKQSLFDTYLNKINMANGQNKEIVMTKELYKKLSLQENINVDVNFINTTMIDFSEFVIREFKHKLYKIDTPILGVFGVGDYCNKFDIQLGLRSKFEKDGYKVSQLGTKQYSELFGIYNLPEFLFASDMSMENKILNFNHYIHNIEINEEPDIIILGIPGGIMPLSNEYTNYFGELALIMSKAVPIDIGILSIYYTKEIEIKTLNDIKQYCKYALQCDVDYFNLANIKYEREPSSGEVYFTTISNHKVMEFISEKKDIYKAHNLNLFSILDENSFVGGYECIISDLTEGIVQI